jgi:hypothetical protein
MTFEGRIFAGSHARGQVAGARVAGPHGRVRTYAMAMLTADATMT